MKALKKIPGPWGAIRRHTSILLPRVTVSRILNLVLVGYEMLFRRTRLFSKPVIAKIEASSACNLRCKGCRTGWPFMEYQTGNLSVSDFNIILDKIGKYLFEVVFYIWGEPLLNKNIGKLIDAAHRRNIAVIISTNLHFLTAEMGEILIDSQLDKMIFCIDGWSQRTYEEVRAKGDFELVKNNIGRFVEQKKARDSKKPYLEWQYVVTENNKTELPLAQRAAHGWGVERFVSLVDWAKRLETRDFFKGLDRVKEKMRKKINRCFWLWSAITIQYDGTVFPCCHVANKPHENRMYANILRQDLNAAWNSEKFQQARLLLKSKRQINDGHIVCSKCFSPPIFIELKE